MPHASLVRTIARLATMLLTELGAVVGVTGIVAAQQPPPARKPVAIRVADSTQVQVVRLRNGSSIIGHA